MATPEEAGGKPEPVPEAKPPAQDKGSEEAAGFNSTLASLVLAKSGLLFYSSIREVG